GGDLPQREGAAVAALARCLQVQRGEWSVVPLRWGQRGELFALLRQRSTGELRVCAADVHLPVEKWAPLSSPAAAVKNAEYKSFTFNDHLFIQELDRESGQLRVYHMPDPSAAWTVAFEATLPEEVPPKEEGLCLSRGAELCVFYAQDPTEAHTWPRWSQRAPRRRARAGCSGPDHGPGQGLGSVPGGPAAVPEGDADARVREGEGRGSRELRDGAALRGPGREHALRFPRQGLWQALGPGLQDPVRDARLCCAYVPGKPEPVLMAGSPSDRMLKLCHLNLIEWCTFKQADDTDASAPSQPVLEEKFSRKVLGWSLAGAGRMLGLLSP
ncbi:unnamed protein product, partial [Prorocentrum cordatum]